MAIRVKIDLDADTSRLSEAIQRAMAKGFQGGGTAGLATDPSSVAREIMGAGLFTSSEVGMKRRSRGILTPILPKTPDFLNDPNFFMSRGPTPPTIAAIQAQRASFLKNIGFAGIPLGSPQSLFGNLFASRQIFSGLSGPVGQNLLGKIGIGGTAGTAAATAGIMGVLLAVGTALLALKKVVAETAKAYDEARKLYAKSLLSGLGANFTIGRANLADVLGVNEREVLKFSAAIALIGPKLRFATDVMAKTTPNLASVSYQFGILKKNLEALFFTLANDAAPALRVFADGISRMIQAFTQALQHDPVLRFFKQMSIGTASDALNAIGKLLGGKDMGPAPTPMGMMKQLPVSHLERMGLLVGGFGISSDTGQRTAKATEKSAKLLEKIYMSIGTPGGVGSFADPLFNSP